MTELLILMALAWLLRNWMQPPTDQDCDDWIAMNEIDGSGD
jgi:hypothetical protein